MSNILIVDDQATNRRVLGQLATQLEPGAQVTRFADPSEALEWARRTVPDLVVTDFNMPEMTGADFIAAFRRLDACRDIPVIVVTAYEDEAYRYRALEAGATDFLISPVDHREFITRGRNLLALRASARQKERLAALGSAVAKIHHDLRNSLTSAGLISDYLAESEDDDVRRVAPTLVRAIDRAMNLCSQTMDFLNADRAVPDKESFRFRDLVEEVFATLRLHKSDATLNEGIDPDFEIYADPQHFDRILSNLCLNALQAGATELTVTAGEVDGGVAIEVRDNGPGLPPERRRDLFRPHGASGRKDGTGLGLAIAQELVDAHGGSIELVETSTAGTVFRISLPAEIPAAAAAAGGR